MARRALTIDPEDRDPLDTAVADDRHNLADAFTTALDQLSSADQGSIRGILYRVPVPNGKFEWIRDIYPPFDLSEIMRSLKEEIGGGDFVLRLMAEGKVKKNFTFSIMKDKQPLQTITPKDSGGDMVAMFMAMMQQQSASADRQMQMMMGMGQQQTSMLTALLPAMMGGKDKTSEIMASLAPFLVKGDSMKDALETLTLAKGLFKPEDGGENTAFDADDIVGSVLKIAGPVAGAVGRAFTGRAASPKATQDEAPQEQPQQLMLPQGQVSTGHPLLDLIRADVLFMFARNHDPQKAADMVYDTIEAAGVTEDQINELVAAFAVSPSWLDDLAAAGIDLRTRPEWANEFLAALVAIHSNVEGGDDDFERGAGSLADPGADAEAVTGRQQANGSAQPGG